MAKKYWWQKVTDPDAVARAASRPVSDDRIRRTTALRHAGLFKAEPEIVRGFVNANVPLALAQRSFAEYQTRKANAIRAEVTQAGFGPTQQAPNVATEEGSFLGKFGDATAEVTGMSEGGLFDWLGDAAETVGGALKWTGEAIATGANAAWQTLTLPLTAGYASDTDLDRFLADNRDAIQSVPIVSQLAALGEGIVNYGEGAYRLVSGDVSEQQKQDIARGGGDPNSFGSRVSYYWQDYGEKKTPVSDADVQWLKGVGQYAPDDVDAAREIVTAGALEDLARSASSLTPRARAFLERVNQDEGLGELLVAMADTSQTALGGRLVRTYMPEQEPGEWFGPGTLSRGIAGGIAELVATWHIDPAVLAAKGYQFARTAPYVVRFNSAENIEKTTKMLAASDDQFRPVGALAKRFDQAMETADQIVTAQRAGDHVQAAKLRESWLRRYPGYDKTLDILSGMRNGSVGRIRPRTLREAQKDATEAAAVGRAVEPNLIQVGGDGTPLFRYTWDDGTKLTAEERARERARVVDELSTFVLADAFASGREIVNSRLLLPGQLSINGKVRDVVAPVLEAFTRRDRSLMKQLNEVGKGRVDLDGHVAANEVGQWDTLVNPASAEWYRNNYTFGVSHTFARGWRNLEKTFSNKVIVPTSPDSTKVFGELVSSFMPKRQAQVITAQYASANPAERWMMTRQTYGALLNTMNLRNTETAQQIVEQATKGLVRADDAINGYKTGGFEIYTTPDKNFIKVGDMEMPAAVHPWQVAEGIQLPNMRELRQLANRGWALNLIHEKVDGPMANAVVRIWKSSKVTTYTNMLRQVLEGVGFTAARDPKVLRQMPAARQAVKGAVLTGKIDSRDVKRLVATSNKMTAKDLKHLEDVRVADPEQFVDTMKQLLAKNGFDSNAADVLSRMAQEVDVAEYWGSLRLKGPISAKYLAAMGPWDHLRRARAELYTRMGGSISDTPMSKYLDDTLTEEILQGAMRRLGYSAEAHAWNPAESVSYMNRELVVDAAGKGISMRPTKVQNAFAWENSNPDLWAAALGRRQSDPTGMVAMQMIAHRAVLEKDIWSRAAQPGGQLFDVDAAVAKEMEATAEKWGIDTNALRNVDDLMTHLYHEHPWGERMRSDAGRAQILPDGTVAKNPADREVAARRAAQDAVDDLVYHMGGSIIRDKAGAIVKMEFPDEMEPILRRIIRGDTVGAAELRSIPDEVRPDGLAAQIYAPKVPGGKGRTQRLADLASRAYSTVVARPMENLYMIPAFVAHKRVAYGEAQGLMEAMVQRGLSQEQAAYQVEAMVTNRAIQRVFKSTDNPAERTVFADMGDKWLMFLRANLDFLRRLGEATVVSPVALARANLLVNAGVHTGIMHSEPYQDEEGNAEERLTFTYPASGLAQRALADAGVALGLLPDELTRVPQFDGFKSQVRFLNPGMSNPVGFSVNPIFGHAIDAMEKIWPGATVDLERVKRALSGGQDFEGTTPALSLKNLTPTMFSRFVPLMQQGDVDGQFQSAMRAAMMYSEVAGTAPGADASPSERARFLDSVKATAVNIMTQRALFGMFLPAAPLTSDPREIEVDTLGRVQGLTSLRSEFFDIRSELSQRYPDNFMRANSEAVAEFARRYPGDLIVNPAAFSVGSTKVSGVDEGYVPYTIGATEWMFENLDFLRANPQLAIAMMPKSLADGDFSNEAYKLQLKFDIRTHKDLEQFYDDLTLSDDIGEYRRTRSAYFTAAKEDPTLSKAVYAKMNNWEDGWRRTHPLASAELDRRADPNFVHSEVAPALARVIDGTDQLPQSMQSMRPQIQEMYEDYQNYRDRYMSVDYYDNPGRSKANAAYKRAGDEKWLDTPLEGLWDLMRVTEG